MIKPKKCDSLKKIYSLLFHVKIPFSVFNSEVLHSNFNECLRNNWKDCKQSNYYVSRRFESNKKFKHFKLGDGLCSK